MPIDLRVPDSATKISTLIILVPDSATKISTLIILAGTDLIQTSQYFCQKKHKYLTYLTPRIYVIFMLG